ncbi:radical SAM protein [Candidatus Woesearchaeota archaeon]|nr:radical SAM protein [Candidatus Woesearchaeota archaeon]
MKKKKKIYCPHLWNNIFIDQVGNVYCCEYSYSYFLKKNILGNIYDKKLKDIYCNKILSKLRKKLLDGKLKCFNNCAFLNKNKIGNTKKEVKIDYHKLKKLVIRFGESCNLNCIMCFLDSKKKKCLDYKKIIENVDLSPFEVIEIEGGEPLYMESVKKFFDYAASKDKKISFLTNGTLINDVWADKIALNSSYICFSLNAATKKTHELINKGSKWNLVLKNIQMVRKAKKKYNSNVKIIAHMTLVKENIKEIPLFIKKFKTFGVDSIEWGFDISAYLYLKKHEKEKEKLKNKIKRLLYEYKSKNDIDLSKLKLLSLV